LDETANAVVKTYHFLLVAIIKAANLIKWLCRFFAANKTIEEMYK